MVPQALGAQIRGNIVRRWGDNSQRIPIDCCERPDGIWLRCVRDFVHAHHFMTPDSHAFKVHNPVIRSAANAYGYMLAPTVHIDYIL